LFKNTYGTKIYNILLKQTYLTALARKNMTKKAKFSQNKTGMHPASMAILIIALLILVAGVAYVWMTMQNRTGHAIQIQSVTFQLSITKIHLQNIGQVAVSRETQFK
jgi:hypothetical protein